MNDNKRNYIRRKKYLSDSYDKIKKTLIFLNDKAHIGLSDAEIHKQSLDHAKKVEAACWSPHLKLSAKEYEDIANLKTSELCKVLTQQYLPQNFLTNTPQNSNISFTNPKSHEDNLMNQKRALTPQQLPIPIVPKSAPNPLVNFDPLYIPQPEQNFLISSDPKISISQPSSFYGDIPDNQENPFHLETQFPTFNDDYDHNDYFLNYI